MSASYFKVDTHVVLAQHIRDFRLATDDDSAALQLQVKQYTPLANLEPRPGDVTLIAAHANGFPKELYEPLWDELLARSDRTGIRIRGIWIADVAHQGQSGIMNERLLGNEPSWNDHSRDLLAIINSFRMQMPRPLIGIGHSMGGNTIANLALFHPRLFHSIVMLEPVIQRTSTSSSTYMPAYATMMRKDIWSSREAATKSFQNNPFYRVWDPRALDLFIKFGLRDLPTRQYPDSTGVTLATPRAQEVLSYFRLVDSGPDGTDDEATSRLLNPDMVPAVSQLPFYRSEPVTVFYNLPHLRPSVLYVFGQTSAMSTPDLRRDKVELTGISTGGSGGQSAGRVKEVVIAGAGHLAPMEKVGDIADHLVAWLGPELDRWKKEEAILRQIQQAVPLHERASWTAKYEQTMKGLYPAAGQAVKTRGSKSKM